MPSFEIIQRTVLALIRKGQARRAERLARRWLVKSESLEARCVLLGSVLAAQGNYKDALGLYDSLINSSVPRRGVVHNRAVMLIDAASEGALAEPETHLQEAVLTLDMLEKGGFGRPEIYYNLANGVMSLGDLDQARTLLHTYIENVPDSPEALVNLANAYRETRRYSEAIDLYLRAIDIRPEHDMAWANLAEAFNHAFYMTAASFPHLLILAEVCCRRAATHLTEFSPASIVIDRARKYMRDEGLVNPPEATIAHWQTWFEVPTERPSGEFDTFYEYTARRYRLHLDLFNDCPHPPHNLPDEPICRGFTHESEEERHVPEWFRILNAIHWEFHSARSDYVEAIWDLGDSQFIDETFVYVDVDDGSVLTQMNRRLLQSIAASVNIFDKIAFFLNSYFGLAVPPRGVTFFGRKSVLRRLKDITEKGVRDNLDALDGMARDLDNSFFRRSKRLRDSFTHRYVIPYRSPSPNTESDELAMNVRAESLSSLARDSLMLAKAGINYTSALVTCRDYHRASGKIVIRLPLFTETSPGK